MIGLVYKCSYKRSYLVSFVKIHLFNYIHLMNFLENPEKNWRKVILKEMQCDLFTLFATNRKKYFLKIVEILNISSKFAPTFQRVLMDFGSL